MYGDYYLPGSFTDIFSYTVLFTDIHTLRFMEILTETTLDRFQEKYSSGYSLQDNWRSKTTEELEISSWRTSRTSGCRGEFFIYYQLLTDPGSYILTSSRFGEISLLRSNTSFAVLTRAHSTCTHILSSSL